MVLHPVSKTREQERDARGGEPVAVCANGDDGREEDLEPRNRTQQSAPEEREVEQREFEGHVVLKLHFDRWDICVCEWWPQRECVGCGRMYKC